MVESMIGLLRQNQSFNQATRCYEGLLSDSKIPVFLSSSFPVSTSRYHSLAILFSSGLLGWGLTLFAFSLAIIGCKGSQNLI
ncbi:hypothetical protein CH54_691 [Yersinia rochesterensis]|uniref:Uncharacterized protein n=1 Tax=Yersinia rochesterensis TaxID=1604335 RepID=A0ABN4FBJ1_9GAMM|nr:MULTISPECIES: hypothetical protein [Yersinia]AJI87426.1 hypothetical protein AW19_972 [Yersinia frederiksenii Y225]CNH47207.1 Uncharacterised protein [Yersinia kristensenii]AIN19429.1 hypothetical protein DJ57_1538 [Yersinia rochesterensis]AJJ34371.1 hypothetical protein CH54_691 [Yersinia rochesterensis]CRY65161.1 Uncharacterised protein [Yersinia kristensenii]